MYIYTYVYICMYVYAHSYYQITKNNFTPPCVKIRPASVDYVHEKETIHLWYWKWLTMSNVSPSQRIYCVLVYTFLNHNSITPNLKGARPSQKPLPGNTQLWEETDIRAPSEIRNHNSIRWWSSDRRLWPLSLCTWSVLSDLAVLLLSITVQHTHNKNILGPGGILLLYFLLYLYFFVMIVLALPFVLYCTIHAPQTSMPLGRFELAIPASDRSQTLAFDRSATGIGDESEYEYLFLMVVQTLLQKCFLHINRTAKFTKYLRYFFNTQLSCEVKWIQNGTDWSDCCE
jgi:hypothetical protein